MEKHKLCILVVDDNANIRFGIRLVLEALDYIVDEAETGSSALLQVNKFPYDIIIIDIIMPGMDGLEVISEIKKTQADLAIIAISGATSIKRTYLKAAMINGATATLEKPFDRDDLMEKIRECIGIDLNRSPIDCAKTTRNHLLL